MDHKEAKQTAVELAAWLHFEGTSAGDVVDAAIEKYADLMEVDTGDKPTVPPEPKPDPQPDDGTDFSKRFFQQMRYKGQPNLEQFGLEPLPIHYQSGFFDGGSGPKEGSGDFTPASQGLTQAIAKTAKGLNVIDIEGWWGGNGAPIDPRGIRNFLDVLGWWKAAALPSSKVGLYSTIPIRNYWAVLKGGSRRAAWEASNDMLKPIGNVVDATFPSLYTFYQDREGWKRYASAQIIEAKRIAPRVPCYPYLWPLYHTSNNEGVGGLEIEASFWAEQIKLCTDLADGFVIWTHSDVKKEPFGGIGQWWEETVSHIRDVRAIGGTG